jgi:uncharacterized protein (TIGR02266 family)
MTSVRRRFGRFDRQLPVQIEAGGETFSGETVNVGLGGLFIRTAFDAAFDTTVQVRLELPQPAMTVECQGRVMWSRATGERTEGVGIAFDTLRPIDVWGLLQYFNLSSKATREPAPVDSSDDGF